MSRTITMSWDIVASVRNRIPVTHEIGGEIRTKASGRAGNRNVVDIVFVEGPQCRNVEGVKLRKGAYCSIHKPDYPISFHTHPKSNAPSSTDIRNSIFKHPQMEGYHGKRRLSIVFTHQGVWSYYPYLTSISQWKGARHSDLSVKKEVRKWSLFKRKYGANNEFVNYMRRRGVHVTYDDYTSIKRNGGIEFSFY